jgi:hypothetical protein
MPDLRVIDAEPPGQAVVKVLKDALARARKGEISSVAVALVERDGTADWNWSRVPNNSTLIGAIERMKADLIRDADAQD